MERIQYYFPNLTDNQLLQFSNLYNLYEDWNAKINVISRKDMENFYLHHVLHSLGIAGHFTFRNGSRVLDVGTGGGFPGIPLAIFFPEVEFHLVDSIGKKIKVVEEVSKALRLTNVKAEKNRAEELREKYDFIVSRAVTRLPEFCLWVKNLISNEQNNSFRNGILYLKGGDIESELENLPFQHQVFDLQNDFTEEFFETKKLVYLF